MYHRVAKLDSYDQLVVSPENFLKQMEVLASECNVISLGEAVSLLASKQPVPKRTTVITFDDGYRDNLTEALPILEAYSLPFTVFVTSDFCQQTHAHPRYAADQRYVSQTKLHLDWAEVNQLAAHPLVEIGSHTISHAHLPRLSDADSMREINESKQVIDQQLQQETQFFCYPNGDYFERELAILKASGYRAAVTVSPGINRQSSNLYALRRTEVTDRDSPKLMRYKLDGAFDCIHKLLDIRRRASFRRLADNKGKTA